MSVVASGFTVDTLWNAAILTQAVTELKEKGKTVREVLIEPRAVEPHFFSDRIQGCASHRVLLFSPRRELQICRRFLFSRRVMPPP